MNEVNIEPNCESFIFNKTITDIGGWQRDEDTISIGLWWGYPCVNYDSKERQDAREEAQAEMLKIKNLPKQIIDGIYEEEICEDCIIYHFELPGGYFAGHIDVGNRFTKNIELIIKKYSDILDERNFSKLLKRKEDIYMY
tara:strand:+ start:66 stop:485 length:420 start_codon:yes stop_codon:yes gene_type:complete